MFSIKESIKFGWEKVKANLGLVIGASVVYFIINMLSNMFNRDNRMGFFTLLFMIVAFVVSLITQIGYTKISLKLEAGEHAEISDLFKYYAFLGKYILTYLLYSILVLGGFILLVIPGIYVALRFGFALILVVDKGMKPIDAMKKSTEMTDGKKLHLLKFYIVIAGLNILGLIALGVGLLVTVPISAIACAHVYRKLFASSPEVVVAPEPVV